MSYSTRYSTVEFSVFFLEKIINKKSGVSNYYPAVERRGKRKISMLEGGPVIKKLLKDFGG